MGLNPSQVYCREEFYITNGDNSLPADGDVIALSFGGNGTPTPASGDGAFFTPTGIEAGTRGDSLVRKDNVFSEISISGAEEKRKVLHT